MAHITVQRNETGSGYCPRHLLPNCERVEELLTAAQRQRLVTLETALRALYESFASRYTGAGPQGLLIRAETLGQRPFLHRCDKILPKES